MALSRGANTDFSTDNVSCNCVEIDMQMGFGLTYKMLYSASYQ